LFSSQLALPADKISGRNVRVSSLAETVHPKRDLTSNFHEYYETYNQAPSHKGSHSNHKNPKNHEQRPFKVLKLLVYILRIP